MELNKQIKREDVVTELRLFPSALVDVMAAIRAVTRSGGGGRMNSLYLDIQKTTGFVEPEGFERKVIQMQADAFHEIVESIREFL